MGIILGEAAEERWGRPVPVQLSEEERERMEERFRKLKEKMKSRETDEVPATWEDLRRTFTI